MPIQKELSELKESVVAMSALASDAFAISVAVLASRDVRQVETLRELDRKIDQMELDIDRQCMNVLLKEPYAVDFRFVFSVAKTIIHLERVGDQAKTVGKWALKLPADPHEDLAALAQKTGEALELAVHALEQGDAAAADRVLKLEFEVDALEDRIIEETSNVAEAFVAKALERIGDLATNVAEEVIFAVQARDVRHGQYGSAGE